MSCWVKNYTLFARVVKLADTSDSKSDTLTGVRVQVPPRAQHSQLNTIRVNKKREDGGVVKFLVYNLTAI